ncbi:MAG: cupin domain-containing protein [Acidobacteriaceae bacterium]|nr:cupin domain-containing protein [Acidobacteriaceae bacterium]MBV9296768.1 cupin domain-containing protein [Acidobacteriaceae bacterium]MBV9763673.1 cupin domain-containing protein [Acidobacteriaceae bacterium]
MNGEVKHIRWDQIPIESLNPLLDRQIAVGDQIMVARVLLKKDCVIPLHSHLNEQITHVQSGALHFTIKEQEITVRAGEFLCIPPHVPHTAVALEDTVDIDIFTPPREDWINKTDQYLRG